MVDAISFVGMAAASTGVLYTLSATFCSLGVGFSPAVQALALDIYMNRPENRGEVGKLLGALSVTQALAYVLPFSSPGQLHGWPVRLPLADDALYSLTCVIARSFDSLACDRSQIVSPALYGFVYSNMVAMFPQAIMVVSMCTSMLVLACLAFVRIPSGSAEDRLVPGSENEEHGNMENP